MLHIIWWQCTRSPVYCCKVWWTWFKSLGSTLLLYKWFLLCSDGICSEWPYRCVSTHQLWQLSLKLVPTCHKSDEYNRNVRTSNWQTPATEHCWVVKLHTLSCKMSNEFSTVCRKSLPTYQLSVKHCDVMAFGVSVYRSFYRWCLSLCLVIHNGYFC